MSLAAAIAAMHGHRHLDTDDFFWLPTDPPHRQRRAREERLAMLHRALGKAPAWVLSGSLCEWGDPLIPAFELVVFLIVPSEVRMARLRVREVQRYGAETIAPGGALHQAHIDFLDWAALYDEGGLEIRSRALHDAWLARLPCPVLKPEADRPIIELLSEVEAGFDPRR